MKVVVATFLLAIVGGFLTGCGSTTHPQKVEVITPTTTLNSAMEGWVQSSGVVDALRAEEASMNQVGTTAAQGDYAQTSIACIDLESNSKLLQASLPSPDGEYNGLMTVALGELISGAQACQNGDFQSSATLIESATSDITRANDRLTQIGG